MMVLVVVFVAIAVWWILEAIQLRRRRANSDKWGYRR